MPKVRLVHALILLFAVTLAACPPAKVAPTAAFSAVPTAGTAPVQVTFTDTSAPGSASITSWAWSFGDGQTSTARNPVHTYTTAGTYSVTLSVASSAGQDTITVSNVVQVSAPVAPTANFTATPTSGPAPLTVQFTDSSVAGTSPITGWAWNFGDGKSSTSPSPAHTFMAEGTYTVQLTVTSAVGSDVESKANLVTVGAPLPDPVITITRVAANDGVYTLGQPLDITVTLTQTGAGALTALALSESLPSGWSFDQIVGGDIPDTLNPSGEFGDLEFVWFNVPTLPITFTYRILAPLDGASTEVLSGVVLFRTSGGELQSAGVSTTLTRATP